MKKTILFFIFSLLLLTMSVGAIDLSEAKEMTGNFCGIYRDGIIQSYNLDVDCICPPHSKKLVSMNWYRCDDNQGMPIQCRYFLYSCYFPIR